MDYLLALWAFSTEVQAYVYRGLIPHIQNELYATFLSSALCSAVASLSFFLIYIFISAVLRLFFYPIYIGWGRISGFFSTIHHFIVSRNWAINLFSAPSVGIVDPEADITLMADAVSIELEGELLGLMAYKEHPTLYKQAMVLRLTYSVLQVCKNLAPKDVSSFVGKVSIFYWIDFGVKVFALVLTPFILRMIIAHTLGYVLWESIYELFTTMYWVTIIYGLIFSLLRIDRKQLNTWYHWFKYIKNIHVRIHNAMLDLENADYDLCLASSDLYAEQAWGDFKERLKEAVSIVKGKEDRSTLEEKVIPAMNVEPVLQSSRAARICKNVAERISVVKRNLNMSILQSMLDIIVIASAFVKSMAFARDLAFLGSAALRIVRNTGGLNNTLRPDYKVITPATSKSDTGVVMHSGDDDELGSNESSSSTSVPTTMHPSSDGTVPRTGYVRRAVARTSQYVRDHTPTVSITFPGMARASSLLNWVGGHFISRQTIIDWFYEKLNTEFYTNILSQYVSLRDPDLEIVDDELQYSNEFKCDHNATHNWGGTIDRGIFDCPMIKPFDPRDPKVRELFVLLATPDTKQIVVRQFILGSLLDYVNTERGVLPGKTSGAISLGVELDRIVATISLDKMPFDAKLDYGKIAKLATGIILIAVIIYLYLTDDEPDVSPKLPASDEEQTIEFREKLTELSAIPDADLTTHQRAVKQNLNVRLQARGKRRLRKNKRGRGRRKMACRAWRGKPIGKATRGKVRRAWNAFYTGCDTLEEARDEMANWMNNQDDLKEYDPSDLWYVAIGHEHPDFMFEPDNQWDDYISDDSDDNDRFDYLNSDSDDEYERDDDYDQQDDDDDEVHERRQLSREERELQREKDVDRYEALLDVILESNKRDVEVQNRLLDGLCAILARIPLIPKPNPAVADSAFEALNTSLVSQVTVEPEKPEEASPESTTQATSEASSASDTSTIETKPTTASAESEQALEGRSGSAANQRKKKRTKEKLAKLHSLPSTKETVRRDLENTEFNLSGLSKEKEAELQSKGEFNAAQMNNIVDSVYKSCFICEDVEYAQAGLAWLVIDSEQRKHIQVQLHVLKVTQVLKLYSDRDHFIPVRNDWKIIPTGDAHGDVVLIPLIENNIHNTHKWVKNLPAIKHTLFSIATNTDAVVITFVGVKDGARYTGACTGYVDREWYIHTMSCEPGYCGSLGIDARTYKIVFMHTARLNKYDDEHYAHAGAILKHTVGRLNSPTPVTTGEN